MSANPLIRRPSYAVASTRRYRLSARPKQSFNTPLKAVDLIATDRLSEVRIEDGDAPSLHITHPLKHGSIREILELRDTGRGLVCHRLVRHALDADEVIQRTEEVNYSSDVVPLPETSYPEVMLPFLLSWQPLDGVQRNLFAWINDRFVARVQYLTEGNTTLSLPIGRRDAIAAVMYPDFNDWVPLGRVLNRLAWPFVPKYRMWFDPKPPHGVLRFEGPYGPPGAPEIILELAEES